MNRFASSVVNALGGVSSSFVKAIALLLFSLCVLPAHADFLYKDFSSVAGLKLNGNAAQIANALRVSRATSNSRGSAFTIDPVSLGRGNSFSAFFQFRISDSGGVGDADGRGADGLVFVIQTVSNSVGTSGGGIGYSGIRSSVGIEFDTYNNGRAFGDPNGNHVGIDLNGNIASVQTQTEAVRFNNGETWNSWVDYNGNTDLLEVRWSLTNTRPLSSQLSRTVDLASTLGKNTAFVGFTSATGSGFGNHDILRWEFRGRFAPVMSAAPEPSVLALLLPRMAMGAWIIRRRGIYKR